MSAARFAGGTYRGRGTRFRLYAQPPILKAVGEPETVWISLPPGSIGPGPADRRMYVVDAVGKASPYDFPVLPPWDGPRNPPVQPGPDGHFDHLEPGSRDFMAAHMYGALRFVLDVWERYWGEEIPWHFAAEYPRLELVPAVEWSNAHSGYGFIETGYARPGKSDPQPFALNFDVLAHEMGHAFVYALFGIPPPEALHAQYLALHEWASDCVAIVAVLHFDSVVDRLLERTRGNLYVPNELNRIGELSENEQIRLATHSLKVADVPSLDTPAAALSYPEIHAMSLPLTGAVFDLLVEVFEHLLVEDKLISPDLDRLSRQEPNPPYDEVQEQFDLAYAGHAGEFKTALLDARDYVGRCLAVALRKLSWASGFGHAATALLAADREVARGAGQAVVLDNLLWRGIKPSVRPASAAYRGRVARARAARWQK